MEELCRRGNHRFHSMFIHWESVKYARLQWTRIKPHRTDIMDDIDLKAKAICLTRLNWTSEMLQLLNVTVI